MSIGFVVGVARGLGGGGAPTGTVHVLQWRSQGVPMVRRSRVKRFNNPVTAMSRDFASFHRRKSSGTFELHVENLLVFTTRR